MYNITCAALAAYTMRERIMHSVTRHVNQIAVVVHEQDYRINDIRNSDTVPKTCHCCFLLVCGIRMHDTNHVHPRSLQAQRKWRRLFSSLSLDMDPQSVQRRAEGRNVLARGSSCA